MIFVASFFLLLPFSLYLLLSFSSQNQPTFACISILHYLSNLINPAGSLKACLKSVWSRIHHYYSSCNQRNGFTSGISAQRLC